MEQNDSPELQRLYDCRQQCVERLGRIGVQRTLIDRAYLHNISLLLQFNDMIRGLQDGET